MKWNIEFGLKNKVFVKVLIWSCIFSLVQNVSADDLEKSSWKAGYYNVREDAKEEYVVGVFEKIFKDLGQEVKFQKFESVESIVLLDKGKLDIDLGRVEKAIQEFPNVVKLNVPISVIHIKIISPTTRKLQNGLKDLAGKKVLVNEGSFAIKKLLTGLDSIELVEIRDERLLEKNLNLGRAEYAVIADFPDEIHYLSEKYRIETISKVTVYASIHKSKLAYKSALEAELEKYFPLKYEGNVSE